MSFEELVSTCIMDKGLVEQFNKLYNHNLLVSRSPIEIQIDNACNYNLNHEAINDFLNFVFEFIWLPLVAKEQNNENY